MVIHSLMIAAALLGGQQPQKPRPIRSFVYDAAAIEAQKKAERDKLFADAAKAEAAKEEAADQKNPVKKPTLPPSYVNISGNFGGVFYVNGVGSATSQSQSNAVNVTTNRALTFTATSFKALTGGNAPAGSMGSVTYSMALYQGTSAHRGSLVVGPVIGTDAGFNGQTLVLSLGQIPSGGNLVLVLDRTLTINGTAAGATKFMGTGTISVAIN